MVSVAVRALAAVGVKVRLRTQLAPAASVAPLMQVVPEASAKSPALAPPSTAVAMLRGAVPLLVRVTVCTGLGVLTGWKATGRNPRFLVRARAMIFFLTETDCGPSAASAVMVTLTALALAAVGVMVPLRI